MSIFYFLFFEQIFPSFFSFFVVVPLSLEFKHQHLHLLRENMLKLINNRSNVFFKKFFWFELIFIITPPFFCNIFLLHVFF
jgi:hypothetical protein